jgi:HAD superfamily hydrolase (TIGR01509 family)
MLIMIEAILFDLDGLIVDSEPHSLASWQAVLARRGAQFDQPTIDSILGLRLVETARLAIRLFDLNDEPAALAQEKTDYQITHLDGNVQPLPGLIDLLDLIDQRGLQKSIASSGTRAYVQAVLAATHLSDRFDTVVTGDDVIHGKPAPDVFLAAAQALHVAPENCLVLEDAPAGVQAAKAAHMLCFAVPNDFTRSLDLSLADAIMPSLFDVRAILTNNE